jgi:hypothetical protein
VVRMTGLARNEKLEGKQEDSVRHQYGRKAGWDC